LLRVGVIMLPAPPRPVDTTMSAIAVVYRFATML
jgi:hypothetical protein